MNAFPPQILSLLLVATLSSATTRLAAAAAAAAPLVDRERDRGGEIVLIKQAGVLAYEEVAESFTENFRVRVRQVQIDDTPASEAEARRRALSARYVVAVGQPSVRVAKDGTAVVLYAMAPDPPKGAIGSDSSGPPELLFRALLQVRPGTRRIGAFASHRPLARLMMEHARAAARTLGLGLKERPADTGPQAIAALRALIEDDPKVDAVWIGADPDLVTTPVFQYLLRVQLRRGVPILAATRQQVRSGALLSVDFSPSAVGRRLAALTNLVLEGVHHPELSGREDPAGPPMVTLNALMARKLDLDLAPGRSMGWRIE